MGDNFIVIFFGVGFAVVAFISYMFFLVLRLEAYYDSCFQKAMVCEDVALHATVYVCVLSCPSVRSCGVVDGFVYWSDVWRERRRVLYGFCML